MKTQNKVLIPLLFIIILFPTIPYLSIVKAETSFIDDFEFGIINWSGFNGEINLLTSPTLEGESSIGVHGRNTYLNKDLTNFKSSINFRFYIYIDSHTPAERDFAKVYGEGGVASGIVQLSVDEWGSKCWKFYYRDYGWKYILTQQTFEYDTWYCIETYVRVGNGNGESKLLVNDEEIVSVSGLHNWDRGYVKGVLLGASSYYSVDGIYDSVVVSEEHIGLIEAPEAPPEKYDLSLVVSGSGSTSPSVGSYTYLEGSKVTVTAYESSGWSFNHWVFDSVNVGSDNPYTLTMDSDHSLTAIFTEVQPEEPIEPTKTVYVVNMVDAEILGGHNQYIDTTDPYPILDLREYRNDDLSNVAEIMDADWRNSHHDYNGKPFVVTWFTEMDYLISQGECVYEGGIHAGVSGYMSVYDVLMNNWETEIDLYGDCFENHHHFMVFDETWQRFDDFSSYPGYHLDALDAMILDNQFYPTCWDSGWGIMPESLSEWLDGYFPFDYTYFPNYWVSITEWYPIHTISSNRWAVQTDYLSSQEKVNEAFAYAEANGVAIYGHTIHTREDMKYWWDVEYQNLENAMQFYPDVKFEFVTAREAVQLALGYTDLTCPLFTLTQQNGVYTIESNEKLWANNIYVALDYQGTYDHITPNYVSTNTWTFTPANPEEINRIGLGGIDISGNPSAIIFENNYAIPEEPEEPSIPIAQFVNIQANVTINSLEFSKADPKISLNTSGSGVAIIETVDDFKITDLQVFVNNIENTFEFNIENENILITIHIYE